MSDKERIVQLLDDVPAYKLGYILAYVQGLTAADSHNEQTKVSSSTVDWNKALLRAILELIDKCESLDELRESVKRILVEEK